MLNLIGNQINTVVKSILFFIVGMFSLIWISGCVNDSRDIGDIIDTDIYTFYQNPDGRKSVMFTASPAIIISRKDGKWYQVMAVNGQTAWTSDPVKVTGKVTVKQWKDAIDFTKRSTEQLHNSEHEWQTVSGNREWTLLGATGRTFTMTPLLLKEQGRGNLLPTNISPYELPELEISSNPYQGWTSPLNLKFTLKNRSKQIQRFGIYLQPFFGILGDELKAREVNNSLTVLNLSTQKQKNIKLPIMAYQPEMAVMVPDSNNTQLDSILFLTNNKNSTYVLQLKWQNGNVHYLAYTGWNGKAYERIAAPLLVGYRISDENKDGIGDLVLKVAHINGDGYAVETLTINGRINRNMPVVKVSLDSNR